MIRVLNLGAGVQSSTILLMACRGELPKPDVCIFADTEEEPRAVYEWLDGVLRPEAARAGIRIDTVRFSVERDRAKKLSNIPAFVPGKDGKASLINRQCTREWKIEPIDRHVKSLLGLKPGARWPKEVMVESWLGISGDEIQRMKHSVEPWRRYWHPLVEEEWSGDGKPPRWRVPPLDRGGCVAWMRAAGLGVAPRSACTFCPLHNNAEWRRMQESDPEAFASAVQADDLLRSNPLRHGHMYVHRSLRPLSEIDFTLQKTFNFDDSPTFADECAGMCGV